MIRIHAVSWMMVVSMAAVCSAGVETFTSEDGRFTVLFPDKPKVGEQVVRLPSGNVTIHLFTTVFPHGTGEMVVSYTDYPAQVLAARKADQMLDDSVTGTVQGMKAKLVKSSRITQAGASGREFSWTGTGPKGPLKGQGRIFLVGPRLYQVLIVGATEKSLSWEVYEMLFKSFEFKPAPATLASSPATTTKPAVPGAMSRATAPGPGRTKGAARGKAPARVPDRWITHTGISYEGPWNLQMPTQPRHTTEPGLFGVRVRNVHVASDGKLTYTLKIQVTPDDALSRGKESVLEAARDKLAEEVNGKVVDESDAQIAGYEGHAYRLEVAGPKPAVVAARAAIVGKRTVVLWVIGDRAAVAGPSSERFLDSFRVGD
jgi:hypothetical protein